MEIITRPLNQDEFAQALAVRMKVFVEEQKVPEDEEHDDLDATATHFGAFLNDELIGTGRIVVIENTAKLGRIAVLAQYRGMNVGFRLVSTMLEWAKAEGLSEAVLGAQLQAIGFYERLGFIAEGGVYDDAGIPHRTMRRALY